MTSVVAVAQLHLVAGSAGDNKPELSSRGRHIAYQRLAATDVGGAVVVVSVTRSHPDLDTLTVARIRHRSLGTRRHMAAGINLMASARSPTDG